MRIESQIYGAFAGWHGNALFKLTNGQFWLQAEYKYRYKYLYRPRVVITQSNSGYEMNCYRSVMSRISPIISRAKSRSVPTKKVRAAANIE